jgi:hypothetical protein
VGGQRKQKRSRGALLRPSYASQTKEADGELRMANDRRQILIRYSPLPIRPREGGGAPKGACRPLSAPPSGCRHPNGRARKRAERSALAFRRFTAALATPVATSIGSAPEPGFPRPAKAQCFARLRRFGFRHWSRLNALRVDRSLCRSTGAPGPPGSGSHSSARGHRTSLRLSKVPSRKAPLDEQG